MNTDHLQMRINAGQLRAGVVEQMRLCEENNPARVLIRRDVISNATLGKRATVYKPDIHGLMPLRGEVVAEGDGITVATVVVIDGASALRWADEVERATGLPLLTMQEFFDCLNSVATQRRDDG